MAVPQEGHHPHSILYEPVNALWHGFLSLTGLDARWGGVQVPEHVVMALFVLVFCAVVFIPLRGLLRRDSPGKLQLVLELLLDAIRGMLDDVIGQGAGRRYLPFIGALTVFIFLSNICGQIFFLQPPTSNFNTTFGLALISFFYYHWIGLRRHGLGYFKQFLGPIGSLPLGMRFLLAPLFLILEPISHAARAISLALRLFGNIFGEHSVVLAFVGLIPFLMPVPLMALGTFAAILQTFIFVMLTTVYIAGAEASDH